MGDKHHVKLVKEVALVKAYKLKAVFAAECSPKDFVKWL